MEQLIATGGNPRETALLALSACDQQGAWSDGFLKKIMRDHKLDSRDAAFATRLCFGVLQNRMLLDFYLSQFSSVKPEKLENKVLNALRLGAYQMLFMDRVPHSAAVNESVHLVRRYAKNPRAAGLTNGVLRNLSRNIATLSPPDTMEMKYSHPAWLVEAFQIALKGVGVEALLAADNEQPPTVAQVNTCVATEAEVSSALTDAGVNVTPHPWLPNCLLLANTGAIEHLPPFQSGKFYIQDVAARLAVLAAGVKPGMQVLDACAAPGGKSFAAAIEMKNRGEILACDIHPHKQALIQAGIERLGLSCIQTAVMNGSVRNEALVGKFSVVIADVPCSGLGIIRKKPDIRYKDPVLLKRLPEVQLSILENVSAYVKPGGTLLYATCTVLERENQGVIQTFLEKHFDFTVDCFELPAPIGTVASGMLTLWPHLHGTDGFFIAKLRRAEEQR